MATREPPLAQMVFESIRGMSLIEYGTFMQTLGQSRPDAERDWLIFHGYYDLSDEEAIKEPLLLYQAYTVAHGGRSLEAMRRHQAYHRKGQHS